MSKCPYHDEMRDDIKDIKGDVRSLLKFKWQMIGGTSVVAIIITLAIGLLK